MHNKRRFALLAVILVILMVSCGTGAKQLSPIELTLTPLSEKIESTATARALGGDESSSLLETAVVNATARSEEIFATQTARASLNDASKLATATVIAPVVAELPFYGIDPASGIVAWVQGPLTVDLNGPQANGFANDQPLVTASDFAMASDITWNTKNSVSGCGFMFRSNGDKNKPSQYNILMSRVANGHVAFLALKDGQIANFQQFFPRDNDKSFNFDNGATNRLAVVARGPLIDIYTNEVLVAQLDTTKPPPNNLSSIGLPQIPPNATADQIAAISGQRADIQTLNDQMSQQLAAAKANFRTSDTNFTDGLLGFLGFSQSGQTTCTFDNAWLFQLNQ
jgi:hypothetical protein